MVDLFHHRTSWWWEDQGVDLAKGFAHGEMQVVLWICPCRSHHGDIVEVTIVVVGIAHMEADGVGAVHPDVVVNRTMCTLAQFHTDAHTDVVVNLVV